MPYKVVFTIEKGKSVLTSVPGSWEKDGILLWPKKYSTERIKLGSDPKDDWSPINCIVKKNNLLTYEDAEEEIDKMCEYSDTEYSETADEMPANKKAKISSPQPDFNDQAQERIKNIGNQTSSEKNKIEKPITGDIPTILQSILDKQCFLSENQQNITMELVKLNVRFDEFIKAFLSQNDEVENKLDFTPIAKLEDLEELENKLKNVQYKTELKKKFSVVCKPNGKGLNTAYKLIDMIFKRDFMKRCSWAGGSRTEEKKICFKVFKRTIDLFFNMANATDNSFTLEDCETFFKNILKNSKQRSLLTNKRQSTCKNRQKNIKKITAQPVKFIKIPTVNGDEDDEEEET